MGDISKHFILFYIVCFLSGICCLTTVFIASKGNRDEFIKRLRDLILSFFLLVLACFIEFYRIYFFSKWEMNVLIMTMQDVFIVTFLIAWVRLVMQVTNKERIKKYWILVPAASIVDYISWLVVYIFFMDKDYNVTSAAADQWLLVTDTVLYTVIVVYSLYFGYDLLRNEYEKRKKRYLLILDGLVTIFIGFVFFDTLCYYFLPEVFEFSCNLYPFHPLFVCFIIICVLSVFYLNENNLFGLTEHHDLQVQTIQFSFDEIAQKFNLTKREREMIELVFKGLSNPEISQMLNISISTVKRHIQNIYKKMNIKNRFELIYMIKADQE